MMKRSSSSFACCCCRRSAAPKLNHAIIQCAELPRSALLASRPLICFKGSSHISLSAVPNGALQAGLRRSAAASAVATAADKLRRLRVRGEISAFTCIRHNAAPLLLYAARATRFGAPITLRNRSFRSPQPACTAACGGCAGRGTGSQTKCGRCWAGSAV